MDKAVPCRSCGAPILWVVTENGKRMPLDAEPTEAGKVIIRMGGRGLPADAELAHVETKEETEARLKAREPAARTAFMPHHATCPQGREWRRK